MELSIESFESVPDNSIDYAAMEKTRNATALAFDIDCWQALGHLKESDSCNNRIQGDTVMMIDGHNCTINSENRLVGVVGVDSLEIVDTSYALLVADKQRT
ncbi:hypothetical protein [Marinibactrum halimedae]|uniref:MannoseP isomerase/GMP-like beta-helix domain-containing protein n=1 Tax=Marinibactrum halimedae TaxID=1444977 RepID=A0AA37T703_9GAMM|nr:hypothetical protein [Marinibactrum halimedae]MCD9459850.1 hypothetical protein [Marinibactrum halimedae]GLS26956.1 hypothetical protein GCM10007877_26750 [Marinibactrum halimedae]